MANICDYLGWRGDLTLAERSFNDADNVVLSTFSYLDFTGIVPGPEDSCEGEPQGIAFSLACHQLLQKAEGKLDEYVRSLAQIDYHFVEVISLSRRFGFSKLHSYVDIVDDDRDLQFSAIQIDLNNGETYVAYRGTDNTLVGWREDFMLSFKVTEAQQEAARYLEDAIALARMRGRTLRVGGHSKGGNLAEYAAACCSDEERELLTCIYSNDGPCMAPEVMPIDSGKVLGKRLRRIVPTFSVVGMLFANPDDARIIVKSTGKGINQHDTMTWKMISGGVEEAQDLEPDCKALNESIATWMKELPLDERERLTNELFDALGAGGAKTFDDITSSEESLRKVYRALKSADKRSRKLVNELLSSTVIYSVCAAKKATMNVLDQWRQSAKDVAEDVVAHLRESRSS